MKFKSFECEHYSMNVSSLKKEIKRSTEEGIEYSKILSSGVCNEKPINPNAIPRLKKDIELLKKYIESCKRQLDDMLWDMTHAICVKEGSCGQYNRQTFKDGCRHNKFIVIRCRENYYHWGKEICPNCGRLQKWIPFREGKENYGGV